MKSEIKNIVYDTDEAVVIDSWSNGLEQEDSSAWTETLYRSRDGKQSFLLGSGNNETVYANGNEIIPLTGPELAKLYQRKCKLIPPD